MSKFPHIRLHARTYPRLETEKLIEEESRKCHNHKPQPSHDMKRKRKRKRTEIINTCNINKHMLEKHLVHLTNVTRFFITSSCATLVPDNKQTLEFDPGEKFIIAYVGWVDCRKYLIPENIPSWI